jgi:hypothetical protein
MSIQTWRKLIGNEMSDCGDSWKQVVSCTLTSEELDVEFDTDWGAVEGKAFTLWTHTRVYFPVCYDGAEWVSSVSRNPDGHPTNHQGGG